MRMSGRNGWQACQMVVTRPIDDVRKLTNEVTDLGDVHMAWIVLEQTDIRKTGQEAGCAPRPVIEQDYRFRFTSSCRISSEVVMTLEFAWKPRCAAIMLMKLSPRSTLD